MANVMDIEALKNRLDYTPETGVFRWKSVNKNARGVKAGDVAGSACDFGHINICIDHKFFKAHRIAFAMYHGFWPENQIDHINRNPSDNRIANLRQATHAENQQNIRPRKSRLGLYGVAKNGSGYASKITANNKKYHLGTYCDPIVAHVVAIHAKHSLHVFTPHTATSTK